MKEPRTKLIWCREVVFENKESLYKPGVSAGLSLDCPETESSFEKRSNMTATFVLRGPGV